MGATDKTGQGGKTGGVVLLRPLAVQGAAPQVLDALIWAEADDPGLRPQPDDAAPDGAAADGAAADAPAPDPAAKALPHIFRVFFADPAPFEKIAPPPPESGTRVTEMRQISGGLMVAGRCADPHRLVLRLAGRPREIHAPAPDHALFAGRNCLYGQRLEESAETTLDWLAWHAHHHGATGAVIVNRAPPDSPAGTAEDYARALHAGMGARGLDGMAVAVIDSAVPLGKAALGPENHPYLAPDAPGKDRMEVPDPDPWRAPLGQGILPELVKWRFLRGARAVLNLDVTDLLAPPESGAPTGFDLCAAARAGVVLLAGRRIYPWRVRKRQPERFGDHICHQFDARRGIARWGVAPDKAGLFNTWRTIRIAYAKPDTRQPLPFWRAMAIRVPGRSAAELAPKTSLIEDPRLGAALAFFGHKPVRPPVSKPKAAPVRALHAGRTAIVTTMKNEGPFIMEWIAYHRAIGVDDFLVYTNDCTDGTDTMLDMLQRKGLVQHRANPWVPGGDLKPQHAALQAAESEPVIQNAGWSICMDVDEFINVKIGDGTLAALYAAMGEANMISLTWRLFGNSDVHDYADRFLLEQFTRCAPEIVRKPHQAWGFKTLFRNIDIYKKLGVHRPKGLIPDLWDQVRWLNGSGRPMPQSMFRNGWRSTLETYGYDWVQLNHYAVRSAESFLVKRDRGRVNHVDRDQGLNYWFRMNHNAVEDRSIQRMIPRLQAEWDRLMADPEIRAAHAHSVACHRTKIAELRATENYENFYGELCSDRFETLSRMLHVFGSAVFNAGPAVIPADLHKRDLPTDFFFTVEHSGEAEH
ncbi:glycosyltransferase family 2 protein [Phaeovulum vinaykumarii]|uniref:Glycosyl transferase family 2 n=1 Tax=Phaeovulum vinaykumarii TaxID=407234 RepID=A0A1N7LWF9_9RHOB|nr:glycosyltransferase family 2 protein [Phaeovulum vinaykumarii]SIS78041.1 Glycosyl transferase family 2 [Phaeovulum vinaykumarii]SOC07190.1 glycosyl transferase family 2 [Phaeovulum vinaykumarii]